MQLFMPYSESNQELGVIVKSLITDTLTKILGSTGCEGSTGRDLSFMFPNCYRPNPNSNAYDTIPAAEWQMYLDPVFIWLQQRQYLDWFSTQIRSISDQLCALYRKSNQNNPRKEDYIMANYACSIIAVCLENWRSRNDSQTQLQNCQQALQAVQWELTQRRIAMSEWGIDFSYNQFGIRCNKCGYPLYDIDLDRFRSHLSNFLNVEQPRGGQPSYLPNPATNELPCIYQEGGYTPQLPPPN